MKIIKKVELNKNVGGIFFLKFNKNVIPNKSAGGIFLLILEVDYFSGVHISLDEIFSKIQKKPSILQKWMIPHMNGLLVFIKMKQNSKWPTQKKSHFPAPPILNIFSWKFHGLVLGLVELIDAKGIGLS